MIPVEVQHHIDVLHKEYKENSALETFHVLHLYPLGLAYPDGYYDSKWFRLVGFNTLTHQKRDLGKHDGLATDETVVLRVYIYVDGSTCVVLDGDWRITDSQLAVVYR